MPSSAASIGTLWAVTEVLSLVDHGCATTHRATTPAGTLAIIPLVLLCHKRWLKARRIDTA